ncbi:MAG: PAS domain S-box protein [Spirochaetes bacterium]|nr:MAG: PAS domain S-box protein [Spirochaetota bacterium]
MKRIQETWNRLTRPSSENPDDARREYMTRAVLLVMGAISVVFVLISLSGFLVSSIPLDTLLWFALISVLCLEGMILAVRNGRWRIGRFVPVVLILTAAVYGNYVGGMGAPAMILYVLAILLAAMLMRRGTGPFVVAGLSLCSYLILAFLQRAAIIKTVRSDDEFFFNRIIITLATIAAITVLLRFFINLLHDALEKTRAREKELADLVLVNRELYERAREEIVERRKAQEILNRTNEELEGTNEEIQAAMEELEASNAELITTHALLVDSEAKFRTLIESSPVPVVLAREGIVLYVNKAFIKMTGMPPAESVANRSLLEFIAPENRDEARRYIRDRLAGKAIPTIYEMTGLRADGSRFPYEINIAQVMFPDGPVTLAFVTDITERRLAGEALRRSEEKYRTLVESIDEVIFSTDEAGTLTYVSPAIRGITGYEADYYTGRNFADFILPQDLPLIAQSFAELSRGIMKPDDYRLVTASGEARWVRSFSRPILEEGIFRGIRGVLTNIHELKLAEIRLHLNNKALQEALEELEATNEELLASNVELELSEAKYRNVIENIQDVVYQSDPDGLLTMLSPSFAHVLGYDSVEDCLGKSIAEDFYYHPHERQVFLDALREKGSVTDYEITLRRKDGSPVLISTSSHFYHDLSGRVAGVEGIFRDISVRRRAEEERDRIQSQLVHSQKMEAIGTLTSGLAHDFNNMLGGVMGSLSLLEILLAKETLGQREAVSEYLATASEASTRAADLVRQLLSISRKQELVLVPVDIALSIEHVTKMCRNSFPKSVAFEFEKPAHPRRVMADPTRVEQVFLNLCVNASHSMTIMRPRDQKEGGTLTVRLGEVVAGDILVLMHPGAVRDRTYYKIDIRDTGVGMDENTVARVFEPFFSTKKKEEGTGLGLSVAYGIVQHLGGFMSAYSEKGKGSVFSVFLPALAGEDRTETGRGPMLASGPAEACILVIDDEKPLLRVAQGILKSCGYSVYTASSGHAGIDLYRENRGIIDAVLLDVSLPGMSGFEIFAELQRIDPRVCVILCSGFAEDERIAEARRAGAAGFLQKPYGASVLIDAINECVLKKRQDPPGEAPAAAD